MSCTLASVAARCHVFMVLLIHVLVCCTVSTSKDDDDLRSPSFIASSSSRTHVGYTRTQTLLISGVYVSQAETEIESNITSLTPTVAIWVQL